CSSIASAAACSHAAPSPSSLHGGASAGSPGTPPGYRPKQGPETRMVEPLAGHPAGHHIRGRGRVPGGAGCGPSGQILSHPEGAPFPLPWGRPPCRPLVFAGAEADSCAVRGMLDAGSGRGTAFSLLSSVGGRRQRRLPCSALII